MNNPIRNNQTKPNQTQSRALRSSGIERGRVEVSKTEKRGRGEKELAPLSDRRAKEYAWAAEHLPGEHTGFVVSTLVGLELAKEKQTTKTVMARLEAQGRTAKQMGEKGWL